MKFSTLACLMLLLLLSWMATSTTGLTNWTVKDGKTEYDSGYFVGTFYKDAKTNEYYKVIRITDTTIWIAPFESGRLAGQ